MHAKLRTCNKPKYFEKLMQDFIIHIYRMFYFQNMSRAVFMFTCYMTHLSTGHHSSQHTV